MVKTSFTWGLFLLFSFLNCTEATNQTHQHTTSDDALGQILGLVQDMKSQMNNLEVKVATMDEEIKQVKSQTIASTEIIKDQLKRVKTESSLVQRDIKDTVELFHNQVISMVENITDEVKGQYAHSKPQNISKMMEELKVDVSNKLEVIHLNFEDYRLQDNSRCNKNDILTLAEEVKTNAGTQFHALSQSIENMKSDIVSHWKNNTGSIDSLSDQLVAIEVVHKTEGITNKMGALESTMTGLGKKIVRLDSAMKSLQKEINSIKTDALQNVNDRLDKLSHKTKWALDWEDSRFVRPSASHVFRGKLYLFTNKVETFDIDGANKVCQEYDGYLVELNDVDEFDFIQEVINSMSSYPVYPMFFTGYTNRDVSYASLDIKFVHVSSGKELNIDKWKAGEPNNVFGKEGCVEFYATGLGLNDKYCVSDSRYICEVPHPF